MIKAALTHAQTAACTRLVQGWKMASRRPHGEPAEDQVAATQAYMDALRAKGRKAAEILLNCVCLDKSDTEVAKIVGCRREDTAAVAVLAVDRLVEHYRGVDDHSKKRAPEGALVSGAPG